MDIKEVEIKEQVYLSVEQYNTLKNTGSVTVDGETIEFNEDADYITPDETAKNMTALRQELLAEIQKKADTSYVDEQLEGAKKYRHDIRFICRSTSNDTYDIDAYCDFSLYSSVSTAFTQVSEILTAAKTTKLHIPTCCDAFLYEKGFTQQVGGASGNVYLNLSSGECYIYGVLIDLTTVEPLSVILYSSGEYYIYDTVVEI